MIYQYTKKCSEITGYGGRYESDCRQMVIAGMEYLEKYRIAKPTYCRHRRIFGATYDNGLMIKLIDAIRAEKDCTMAMMWTALNHVIFAKKNGWKTYIEELEKT